MAAMRIETERKFEGGPADTRLEPRNLPGVAGVLPAPDEELDALYYDTEDLRLLAHGVTLRRRSGGHDAGWHLKRSADTERREELQLPDADTLPDELLVRVRALARDAPLVPVLRMRTLRTREHLVDKSGAQLAEVARDQVSAEVQTGTPRTETWSELEVELEDGEPALLDAVEKQLKRLGWHRSASSSKTARVLANGSRPDDALPRPGTAGHAVHARVAAQTKTLLAKDPGVRLDEPEAVHDMRVAARRLRSVLRSYRRLFDRRITDPLQEELRWLGQVLGDARDHEVLAERLRDSAAELASAHSAEEPADVAAELREASARIRAREASSYRRARGRALHDLDSERYFRLLDQLDAIVAAPPLRDRASGAAAPEFRRAARREHRRLARRIAAAHDAAPGPARDTALHEARKAAKRARYAGEVALPYAGKPARRFTRRIKKVQQLLGEHQDAVVARAEVFRLATAAHAKGVHTFAYGLLYAAEESAAQRAEDALPKVWSRAKSRKLARI